MPSALPIFQALADPTRLRILVLLREMELSVGELAQVLGQSQPRVSRHLKIMDHARIVARRKEGHWVFLTLGPDRVAGPALAALDAWDDGADAEWRADRARLETIRRLRATDAEDWFETHAAEWDALRSLHVADAQVEAAILRLLGDRPLGRLLDIGTGTGRMVEILGPAADTLTAVDRSPAMLRLARSKLAAMAELRVEWRQGDLHALPLPPAVADTVVMHQVLHYATRPGVALGEAARVLAPGGRLLVVDFVSHGRTELRAQAAHAWLGFTNAQMHDWLAAAGLRVVRDVGLHGELEVRLWLAEWAPGSGDAADRP